MREGRKKEEATIKSGHSLSLLWPLVVLAVAAAAAARQTDSAAVVIKSVSVQSEELLQPLSFSYINGADTNAKRTNGHKLTAD